MPLRAKASTAHEPTPPTPTTQTCAWVSLSKPACPYSRAIPPKRRKLSNVCIYFSINEWVWIILQMQAAA